MDLQLIYINLFSWDGFGSDNILVITQDVIVSNGQQKVKITNCKKKKKYIYIYICHLRVVGGRGKERKILSGREYKNPIEFFLAMRNLIPQIQV